MKSSVRHPTVVELTSVTHASIPLFVVPSWVEEGIFHGFLGIELPFQGDPSGWERWANEVTNESWTLHTLNQLHGCQILPVEATEQSTPHEGDGWMLSRSDGPFQIAAAIKSADCFPVLLKSSGWVAALHAGWRGVLAGILEDGIRAFLSQGEIDIEVAIGPGIQVDSFAVGAEVLPQVEQAIVKLRNVPVLLNYAKDNFACYGEDKEQLSSYILATHYGDNVHIDLQQLLLFQAMSLGVLNIAISFVDTYRSSQHFSFRRDATKARQLSFIGVRPA